MKQIGVILLLILFIPYVAAAPLAEATSNLSTEIEDPDPSPTPSSSGGGGGSGRSSYTPTTTTTTTTEPECVHDQYDRCPLEDGDSVRFLKFKCVNGEYHSTGKSCDDYDCIASKFVTCSDGTIVQVKDCVDNKYVDTNLECEIIEEVKEEIVILPPEINNTKSCTLGKYSEELETCSYSSILAQICFAIFVTWYGFQKKPEEDEGNNNQD